MARTMKMESMVERPIRSLGKKLLNFYFLSLISQTVRSWQVFVSYSCQSWSVPCSKIFNQAKRFSIKNHSSLFCRDCNDKSEKKSGAPFLGRLLALSVNIRLGANAIQYILLMFLISQITVSGKAFQPRRMFVRKAGAYPRGAPLMKVSSLSYKHQTQLDRLAKDKHSSLFGIFVYPSLPE